VQLSLSGQQETAEAESCRYDLLGREIKARLNGLCRQTRRTRSGYIELALLAQFNKER
jgi:predicted DNA-binding protein